MTKKKISKDLKELKAFLAGMDSRRAALIKRLGAAQSASDDASVHAISRELAAIENASARPAMQVWHIEHELAK